MDGNPLEIDQLPHAYFSEFPFFFVQNELLEALAKEIFKQQFIWESVQKKELKECNKIEREIKKLPHSTRCPDVLKRLHNCFEIRDERSPKHSITYNSCLAKLERMVKELWEEWEDNGADSSIW